MNGGFSFVVLVLVVMGIGMAATEVFKVEKTISTVHRSVCTIASDAVELSMDDEFRAEGISVIDGDFARSYMIAGFKERFGLDDSMRSRGEGGILEELRIKSINIENGSFSVSDDEITIISEPKIEVELDILIKARILSHERSIAIPLEFVVENTRIG